MKIFLYARYVKSDYLDPLKALLAAVERYGWHVYSSRNLYEFIRKNDLTSGVKVIDDHENLRQARVDMAITLGGDGTILGATCMIRDLGITLMGINLGRLGFLSSVERKKIDLAMEYVANGEYTIEERGMLTLSSDPPLFGELNFALNDFTVHKRDTSSMINIHVWIDGEFLNAYWADGLIIATPTGSTGYSLSCGGPIIFPSSDTMILTPVAPHNLNVRPLVISDTAEVTVALEGRAKKYLCTLDSRYETITVNHKLSIKKCPFHTKLVLLKGQSFLHTIHEKLSWGSDRRN